MGIDDDLFAQALGAGSADIVHAERFDHGGADVAGHAAERADRHDEHRQRHIVDLVEERTEAGKVIARRLHSENRQPAERDREQPDKNQCNDVDWNRVAHNGQHLHGVV